MKTMDVAEAARSFIRLLKGVEAGEEITITRFGKAIATLGPPRASDAGESESSGPPMRARGFRDRAGAHAAPKLPPRKDD